MTFQQRCLPVRSTTRRPRRQGLRQLQETLTGCSNVQGAGLRVSSSQAYIWSACRSIPQLYSVDVVQYSTYACSL